MTHEASSADTSSPITRAMFHILLVLVEHECHGYSIMREVAGQTRGGVRLAPGTLH
jgi:DNA-binding PadR family transcriptional regulator